MSICVNGLFSEVTIYGSSFPFFKLTSDLIGWRQDWLQRNGSKFQFINLFSPYTILYKIPYNTSVDRLEQTSLGFHWKTWFFVENCSRATPRYQNIAFILTVFDNSGKISKIWEFRFFLIMADLHFQQLKVKFFRKKALIFL